MGPVVLDTSVVVAFSNPLDAHHEHAFAEITARRKMSQQLKVSVVTIAELHSLAGPGRKARIAQVGQFIDALGEGAVVGVDHRIAELAGAQRARRPSLQLADSLIKATADSIDGQLLTADRRLAKLSGVNLLGENR
ncbi:MAG: PIN domain-containing protein [Solirubrobacterales bacterium]